MCTDAEENQEGPVKRRWEKKHSIVPSVCWRKDEKVAPSRKGFWKIPRGVWHWVEEEAGIVTFFSMSSVAIGGFKKALCVLLW